jgi:hypothetical protein
MAVSDIAISLDVTHTWLTSAGEGAPRNTLAITSGQLGVSFTFDPAALECPSAAPRAGSEAAARRLNSMQSKDTYLS